jgi:hypothetical protein
MIEFGAPSFDEVIGFIEGVFFNSMGGAEIMDLFS